MYSFLKKVSFALSILLTLTGSYIILSGIHLQHSHPVRGYFNSNLLYIPDNKLCDLVFLGSSHSRIFEVCENWRLTEDILKKKIVNLSEPGGGLLNQQIYLDYFFSRNNRTNTFLYFVDPFMFVSDQFDNWNYLDKEPFVFDFLFISLKDGIDYPILYSYIKSKTQLPRDYLKKYKCQLYGTKIEKLDPVKLETRISYLTGHKSISKEILQKQIKILDKTIAMILKNGGKLVFIIPPYLLGNVPGYKALIEYLERNKKERNIPFYDFSSSMKDPKYYFDYDHLNPAGIEYFLKTYLNEVVKKQ